MNSQEKSERSSLLAVMQRAKAHMPIEDYTGVITWEGGSEVCLHNSLGIQIGCWTLEELIKDEIIDKETILMDKESAEYVMACIIEKIGGQSKQSAL